MAKVEWGTKRICHSCNAPFYDLHNDLIICPKCGIEYDPEAVLKSRRGRSPLAPDKEPSRLLVSEEMEVVEVDGLGVSGDDIAGDVIAADPDEEEELIEDASELGKDEDDMAEVIENIGTEDER